MTSRHRLMGVLIAALSTFAGCEPVEVEKVVRPGEENPVLEPANTSTEYPIDHELTDAKGRKLEVEIIGRTGDALQFVRKLDGKHYDLPIERLSSEDQDFVRGLPLSDRPTIPEREDTPVSDATPVVEKQGAPPPEPIQITPPYVTDRLQVIKEHENELNDQKQTLEKAKSGIVELEFQDRRNHEKRIIELEAEIIEIKEDIEIYKRNNTPGDPAN